MKKLLLFIVVILFTSCSTGYHYSKTDNHKRTQIRTKHDIKKQQKERNKILYGVKKIPQKNWGY